MSNPIRQEIEFKTNPQRVYDALLDAKQFSAFTGAPAEIDRQVGGAFSCFGGIITGRNIELVPNKRIVQAWRVKIWPEGLYSIVAFELQPEGSGTRLVLTHDGFPARYASASERRGPRWGMAQAVLGAAAQVPELRAFLFPRTCVVRANA